MDVSLALVADAANIERSGKLNVLGVFDTVRAREFPAVHPMMQLVIRFDAGPAEFGQTKQFEVVLVGSDGEQVGALRGELTVPRSQIAGRRAVWNEIVPLPNTPFARPGDYQIDILINGESKRTIPLYAVEVEAGEEG